MTVAAEPITVLHYTSVWLPQTETWLYDQLVHLPAWVQCHVVCESATNLEQFAVPNLYCLAEASALRRYWDQAMRRLRVRTHLGFLATEARKIAPDIVHSHFGNAAWANHKAVHKLGSRHVATFYGLDVNQLPTVDPRWRARYRELFGRLDRVLCEGPHMACCLIELGCPRAKVRVHHLGVRVDEIPYRPRSWQPGTPLRVLIAASFREKKGIPYALAALGAIQREVSLQVTLIGDATADPRSQHEKARILHALKEHGLESCTRMLGFCSHERLMKEAYDHHVFLSPSVTASDGDTEGGAPFTILEMAASGMPIVSTRHCDIPNVLPTGALLAEERDASGLVDRLRCPAILFWLVIAAYAAGSVAIVGVSLLEVFRQLRWYWPFTIAVLLLATGTTADVRTFFRYTAGAAILSSSSALVLHYLIPAYLENVFASSLQTTHGFEAGRMYWTNVPLTLFVLLYFSVCDPDSRIPRWLAGLALVLSLSATFNTLDRTIMAGIVTFLIGTILIARDWHEVLRRVKQFFAFAVLLAGCTASLMMASSRLRDLVFLRYLGRGAGPERIYQVDFLLGRMTLYRQYWASITNHFPWGQGFGRPYSVVWGNQTPVTDISVMSFVLPLGIFGVVIFAVFLRQLWRLVNANAGQQFPHYSRVLKLLMVVALLVSLNMDIFSRNNFVVLLTLLVLCLGNNAHLPQPGEPLRDSHA